jgi:hypothetical protein
LKAAKPVEEPLIGGTRDEHGCFSSAGYSWHPTKGCIQAFNEPKEAELSVDPVHKKKTVLLKAAKPVEEPLIGGTRDEHGCFSSAGYTWHPTKGCIQPFNEPKEVHLSVNPVPKKKAVLLKKPLDKKKSVLKKPLSDSDSEIAHKIYKSLKHKAKKMAKIYHPKVQHSGKHHRAHKKSGKGRGGHRGRRPKRGKGSRKGGKHRRGRKPRNGRQAKKGKKSC